MACYDKDWGVASEINYPFIINVISTVSKRFEDVAAGSVQFSELTRK